MLWRNVFEGFRRAASRTAHKRVGICGSLSQATFWRSPTGDFSLVPTVHRGNADVPICLFRVALRKELTELDAEEVRARPEPSVFYEEPASARRLQVRLFHEIHEMLDEVAPALRAAHDAPRHRVFFASIALRASSSMPSHSTDVVSVSSPSKPLSNNPSSKSCAAAPSSGVRRWKCTALRPSADQSHL